jgi:hypothetical protein
MFAWSGGNRPRLEVTAGGLALLGLGGLLGYQAADMVDRKIAGQPVPAAGATSSFKLPTGVTSIAQYDDLIVSSKPSAGRIGAQLGLAALGFVGGALVPWDAIKMLAYGFGFGAFFHAGGQIITQYIVAPMFATNGTPTANGVEMYSHEFNANNLINPPTASTTSSTTPSTGSGPPPRVGAPVAAAPGLPIAQPIARMPHALRAAANALGSPLSGGATSLLSTPQAPVRIMTAPTPAAPAAPAPLSPPVSTQTAPTPPTGQRPPRTQQGGGHTQGNGGCASCGPDCTCATCSAVYAEKNADMRMGAPPPPANEESTVHPLWSALLNPKAA